MTTDTAVSTVAVERSEYRFTWSPSTDRFVLQDARGLEIVSAPLQPAVVLENATVASGIVEEVDVDDDALVVRYAGVNGSGRLEVTVRFRDDGLRFEAPVYRSDVVDEVVSLLAFAETASGIAQPGLAMDYLVHPGGSESSVLGPVIPAGLRLDLTTWLGRGSNDSADIVAAQWGLPIHYLAGFSIEGSMCERGALTDRLSASFCLGLAEVPTGDLVLRHRAGRVSPELRLHSDLWHQATAGQGELRLGAPWLLTVAPTYDEAVRAYYRLAALSGATTVRERSPRQLDLLRRSQFNTWGAQCAAGTAVEHFDQAALESIRRDLVENDLRPGIFVVDDKWEGEYGLLEHDEGRFPRFEEFLDSLRDDGIEVGLWAAFLRCDDPASHGLGLEHMLCDPSGRPVTRGNQGHTYYLFDVTQEPVRRRLRTLAQRFVRRYRPALVKFDFGYELPSLRFAAPRDRSWSGELLLVKALEAVIGAMREVDPDLLFMYYNLSPLLLEWVDLHSTDDMYLDADEYHLEANRRLFFSSLLGEIGVPSYGSGGYEWLRMQDIWFDTAAFGPIGSLGSFHGDPRDSSPTDVDLARYAGLAALTRSGTTFTARALAPAYLGGSSGARSASWARFEVGAATVVALRTLTLDGGRQEAALPGVVHSTGAVVVASLTETGIAAAGRIGIVAVEEARVALVGRGGSPAHAVAHLRGGDVVEVPVETVGDDLVVTTGPRDASGTPVERVEVVVESR
ncbi:hypothetical protein AS850_04970 [Frondihabitans sp. 762G35]|uniref:hypothetical protein n=1 Tax=Frondihabitans sp. 762G35 TaxID=1446794 RepID=UPI000D20284D|nr:hypothetical protein [Frondihabitans sp. 762G35]ARC56425.1 hypothetical protein AS850_04970 [Frondihabitans sp. 762G35]